MMRSREEREFKQTPSEDFVDTTRVGNSFFVEVGAGVRVGCCVFDDDGHRLNDNNALLEEDLWGDALQYRHRLSRRRRKALSV